MKCLLNWTAQNNLFFVEVANYLPKQIHRQPLLNNITVTVDEYIKNDVALQISYAPYNSVDAVGVYVLGVCLQRGYICLANNLLYYYCNFYVQRDKFNLPHFYPFK